MQSAENSTRGSNVLDQYADQICATIIAILTAGAIIFPRAMPFFYFSLALLALTELWRTGKLSDLTENPGHFWILSGIFTAWCLFTVVWSAAPLAALGKVVFLAAAFISAWIIMRWLSTLTELMSFHLKLGLFVGFVLGAIFLAIEIGFDQPLKKALMNNFEVIRPKSTRHIQFVNGEVVIMESYLLNRSVAVLNMLFWPAALITLSLFKAHLRWAILIGIFATVSLVTFGSVHETSMIALISGVLVFILTRLMPRFGRISVTMGWILAVLMVIPAATSAYDAKLYKAEWLPDTARARIVFWGQTATLYKNNPILGVGVNTTQIVDDATRADAIRLPDHPVKLRTGRHGHNIYLQTWYELGAIGAILLLVTGLAFLSRMNNLARDFQAYAFASFAVGAVIAAFTWGMWQVWYLAMFAMTAALMQIAVHRKNYADEG